MDVFNARKLSNRDLKGQCHQKHVPDRSTERQKRLTVAEAKYLKICHASRHRVKPQQCTLAESKQSAKSKISSLQRYRRFNKPPECNTWRHKRHLYFCVWHYGSTEANWRFYLRSGCTLYKVGKIKKHLVCALLQFPLFLFLLIFSTSRLATVSLRHMSLNRFRTHFW
jgi:hypothetical protein